MIRKIVLIIFLLLQINAYSQKLTEEKKNEIKQNKHGYIQVNFSDFRKFNFTGLQGKDTLGEHWNLFLSINDEQFCNYSFFSYEKYLFPVPAGSVVLKYQLFNQGKLYYRGLPSRLTYGTYGRNSGWWDQDTDLKTLIINVEEGKLVNLNIVQVSEPRSGVGCCLFMPLPFKIQDIEFEVGKIEDATPYE